MSETLENLKQEPKNAIDINQSMNDLLTSISETVSAKTPSINQLSNIRNILIDIKAANKDLNFVITSETTAAIEKALRDVTFPKTTIAETKTADNVPSAAEINSKINQTIETISNVISLMVQAEKTQQKVPDSQRIDKALVEVLVTILGGGLKQFAAINIPKDETAKNEINVGFTKNKDSKLIDSLTRVETVTVKNTDTVAPPKDITSKQVFRIGQIPSFIQKNLDDLTTFPTKASKGLDDVNGIDNNKTTKGDDEVSYRNVLPTIKNVPELENVSLLLADQGKTVTDASNSVYNATRATPKTTDDVPGSLPKIEKVELVEEGTTDTTAKVAHNVANLPTGPQKPITPLNWYSSKPLIGQALSFFGVTSADVALFAAKAIRDFNTIVNAATLSLEMQNPFKNFLAGVQGGNPQGGKRDIPTTDDDVSLRIMTLSPAEQKPVTVFQQQNAAIEFPDKDTSNFKSRTANIIGTSPGTGFLKIYLLRGPNFATSQDSGSTVVLPFQFEPIVSGDAKAAEYSQISTLARSQAAQVYRKSQERTISVELNYLVVQPPAGDSSYINNAISSSVSDMAFWTEDYIYDYVVRNLKQLVLPNIVNTNYKLAPPIVQVWYGGIDSTQASSTGDGVPDTNPPQNSQLNDIFPTFRTNWFTYNSGTYNYRAFRSLWVTNNISFEYKGGIVNRSTRRTIQVTCTLSLIEIAPSATDNELLIWRPNTAAAPISTPPGASRFGTGAPFG